MAKTLLQRHPETERQLLCMWLKAGHSDTEWRLLNVARPKPSRAMPGLLMRLWYICTCPSLRIKIHAWQPFLQLHIDTLLYEFLVLKHGRQCVIKV